ncbi:hypothetical protein [Legionella waltersii]|nr:hypothetical protein [Legionella waltersii]
MMYPLSKGKSSPKTRHDLYELLQKHSINALRYKKNKVENNYQREVSLLSHYCALLINTYKENPISIITVIESAMNASHAMELKAIDDELQLLFNRRKALPANNAYCEREIADLTFKISDLELKKSTPITDVTEGIIFDALDRAFKNDGAKIPVGFNLYDYQKSSMRLFP